MRSFKKNFLFLTLVFSSVSMEAACSASSASSSSCTSGCSIPCSTQSCNTCECSSGGKTYFNVRPLYQSVSPELISDFRNDKMRVGKTGGAFDFVLFGGKSTKASDLGSYFMPFCKRALTVSEELNTQANGGADLLAQHFNIYTQQGAAGTGGFESTFTFCARQSAVGFGMHYKQGFLYNDDNSKWWYIDLNMPVMHIKNSMIITEAVQSNGGGIDAVSGTTSVANMTQAFRQTDWCFGKINNCPMRKTGVADIELKVGREFWYSDQCFLGAYIGALIPTGNKPEGHYIFEPIIGNGKSAGVIWGAEGVIDFWHSCNGHWNAQFAMNAHAQYLFNAKQVRSFDLKNKPWSRYMLVYANQAQAQQAADLCAAVDITANIQGERLATPGINVFTKSVKVRPGFSANGTAAVIIADDRGFVSEIGYNCFARQAECVKLDCRWQEVSALRAFEGCGLTQPVRTISPNQQLNDPIIQVALADYNQSIITVDQLDLNSAAHPAFFAHIVYGSLGYNWHKDCRVPLRADIGGSYEFGNNRAVIHRWTVWGKFGFAY